MPVCKTRHLFYWDVTSVREGASKSLCEAISFCAGAAAWGLAAHVGGQTGAGEALRTAWDPLQPHSRQVSSERS